MEPEQRKQAIATGLKWVGGIAAVAIATPVIYVALKGALGPLALGVAAFAGLTMIRLAPVVSMKLSNLAMKLIMREAAANPIETLRNLHIEKSVELEMADKAIVDFEAEVPNYKDEIQDFKRRFPEDAPQYEEVLHKMLQLLKFQREDQKIARDRLVDLQQRINRAEAIYKMALATQKVERLSGKAQGQVFQQIKEKVAFDSVRTELNRSFAELNSKLAERQSIRDSIPVHERVAIPENEEVKEPVPVPVGRTKS